MKKLKDKIEIDRELKIIAKSSIVIFIGLFLSKLLTYVYRIIIARNFGPEVYGLFALAIMISGWFILFSSLGLVEGLLRYLSWYRGKKEYQKIKYIYNISISLTFITGILSGILLFFLAEFISINLFHSTELIIFLKVFAIIIPFFLFARIFLGVLQAFEQISWYSFILNVLENIVKVLVIILLILIGVKSNAVIFSYSLAIFGTFLASYLACKYKVPEIFGKYKLKKETKKDIRKEFFSYSWPLMLSGTLAGIFYWIDTFSIGYFIDVFSVGLYNVAIPIALLMNIVPEIFIKIFFPIITKEFSKKRFKVVKELSQQVGKWIFILNLPVFLIMILFPGVIINILFGPTYLPATNALKILAIGSFFSSLFWIPIQLLFTLGKSKLLFMNLVIASIINIILNAVLVPKYGINGAAFATTFSVIILSTIYFFEAKHLTSIIPFRRKIIRIFLISLIPTALVLYLRTLVETNIISLVLIGTLFFLVYISLIFLTGCLDKNDFMILRAFKRKIISSS